MNKHIAYLGVGANLGDARATVEQIPNRLISPEIQILAASSIYRSKPIQASGPDFYNSVIKIGTCLKPETLLEKVLGLEQTEGRVRAYKNAPRTLDIDLLLYDDLIVNQSHLTLPHPRLHQRAFVLQPLLELTPDINLPGLGLAKKFLLQCSDQIIEKCA